MRNFIYACLLFFLVFSGCSHNPGKTKGEKIDYVVTKAFEEKAFVGNVLVADKGEVIYKKSFGKADISNSLPNTDTTRFMIASISKPVTALLILRLVEQGKLNVNHTIGSYFKIANPTIGKVTIHQLLTHSSGINEFINKEEHVDFNALVAKATLKFESGTSFEYSNSGYVLLKSIAEAVTGKKYNELVKAEVFAPAGMASSGAASGELGATIAKGYKDVAQTHLAKIDFPIINVAGAGSLYATTEDLYKLDRALYTNSLLSDAMKTQMLKQHIPEKYSYGWFVRERGGVWDVYWHKGDLPGYTSFISRRTQKNQFVVLLSNAENLDVSDIENEISRILKVED